MEYSAKATHPKKAAGRSSTWQDVRGAEVTSSRRSNFSRHVALVDDWFEEEHVETAFVLCEGMTSHSKNKTKKMEINCQLMYRLIGSRILELEAKYQQLQNVSGNNLMRKPKKDTQYQIFHNLINVYKFVNIILHSHTFQFFFKTKQMILRSLKIRFWPLLTFFSRINRISLNQILLQWNIFQSFSL